jgi:hypothetical protein
MYPLGVTPFILIEAIEVGEADENGGALATCAVRAGGGLSHRDAMSLMRSALAAGEAAAGD